MNETSPLAKAQSAAHDLITRTQDATRQFVDTVSESTSNKVEPTAEQVSGAINELIAWARRNSDRLIADLDEFRSGLEARLAPVTVVTKADLVALEARVTETEQKLAKAMKVAPAKPRATKPRATKASATKATKSATKSTKATSAKA